MIRDLTLDDVPRVLDLMQLMADESEYRVFGLHRDRTEYILNGVIGYPNVFAAGAEIDGELVSILIAEINDHMFFDGKVASEVIMYVNPDHRKGLHANRLVDRFCLWSEEGD